MLSCRILSLKCITLHELDIAYAPIMHFGRRVERMYGRQIITQYMHLHGHIKECVIDYGPTHAFWVFVFKQYSGVLGDQPNNNRVAVG